MPTTHLSRRMIGRPRIGGIEMATVSLRATEIFYEESGTGPALLFVHGMCGNADVWSDQIQRLSPHFRCVSYDRRGHTRSPLGAIERRTVQLHADDAAGL